MQLYPLKCLTSSTIDAETSTDREVHPSNIVVHKKTSLPAIANVVCVAFLPITTFVVLFGLGVNTSVSMSESAQQARRAFQLTIPIAQLITGLQEERGKSVMYINTKADSLSFYQQLKEAQASVDDVIERIEIWLPVELADDESNTVELLDSRLQFIRYLTRHRIMMHISDSSIQHSIHFYSDIINELTNVVFSYLDIPPLNAIWKLHVAYGAMLKIADTKGVQRALGAHYLLAAECHMTDEMRTWYMNLEGEINQMTDVVRLYAPRFHLVLDKRKTDIQAVIEAMDDVRDEMTSPIDEHHNNCTVPNPIERFALAMSWFGHVSAWIAMHMEVNELVHETLIGELDAVNADARRDLIIFSALTGCVLLVIIVIIVWYALRMHSMSVNLNTYAARAAQQVRGLMEERMNIETLLNQMLPATVANQLKSGGSVKAEAYHSATLYFSQIVGFSVMSVQCSPHQIVDILNSLYRLFDDTIDMYDVYKVETIADAYVVVSGVPVPNGELHVQEIALMSFRMIQIASDFIVPFDVSQNIQLRVGIHTGPLVAGVVGSKMPRYCLFGDTVNTCSRIETTGEAYRIHISEETKVLLARFQAFHVTLRGKVRVKGKGELTTYWLTDFDPDLARR